MSGGRSGPSKESGSRVSRSNGAPVSEELTAIRSGLHDLERKLDSVESKIVQGTANSPIQSHARVIDFVSATPPVNTSPPLASSPSASLQQAESFPAPSRTEFVPATHSPWVRDFGAPPEHFSQERFGVEEAAVSELV